MDIRKPNQRSQQQATQQVNQQQKETNKFKAGAINTADAKLMLSCRASKLHKIESG